MAERRETRWLIVGHERWLMAVSAWIMSVAAGMKIEEVTKGEEAWFEAIVPIALSLAFWALALRVKREAG